MKKVYAGLWEMYGRPQTKCEPFLIGLLIGQLIYTKKSIIKIQQKQFWQILSIGIFVAIMAIYGILPEYWTPDSGNTLYNTVYTAVFRTQFAMAIAIIIFANEFFSEPNCNKSEIHSEQNDNNLKFCLKPNCDNSEIRLGLNCDKSKTHLGLNSDKSEIRLRPKSNKLKTYSKLWSIMAKLTFNVYLCHMPIVYLFNFIDWFQKIDNVYGLLLALPMAVLLSFTAAFLFYIFVESPLSRLTKLLINYLKL